MITNDKHLFATTIFVFSVFSSTAILFHKNAIFTNHTQFIVSSSPIFITICSVSLWFHCLSNFFSHLFICSKSLWWISFFFLFMLPPIYEHKAHTIELHINWAAFKMEFEKKVSRNKTNKNAFETFSFVNCIHQNV